MRRKKLSRWKLLRIGCSLAGIAILIIAMTSSPRVALHQRVLIQGIGVDRIDEGFQVTVQATATSGGNTVEIYQSKGTTVLDALNNITRVAGKSPFYTHNSILIFGRRCAEEGLEEALDFFVRYHQTRPAESVFLAEDTAAELLTLKSAPSLSVDGETIQLNDYVLASQIEQLSSGDLSPQFLEIHVLDLANALSTPGRDAVLPMLSVQKKAISIKGCGVFSGDRLIDTLSSDETMGMKAITNRLKGGMLTVQLGEEPATLHYLDSDCKVTATLRDGIPHFLVELSCEMNLDSLDRPLANALSREEYTQLERLASQKLEKILQETVERTAVQNGVDILDLSWQLLWQQGDWWKANASQWHTILPNCTYSISATAQIAAVGQEMTPETYAA